MYSYQVCTFKPIQVILNKDDEMIALMEFYDLHSMMHVMNSIRAECENPEAYSIDGEITPEFWEVAQEMGKNNIMSTLEKLGII